MRREFELGEERRGRLRGPAPASPSPCRSSASGTWQSIVTNSFERRTASRFCSSDSRYLLRFTSEARSRTASTLPNSQIRSTLPLSPMPGAPGMLSTRVSAQRHHVDDLFWRNTEGFGHLGGIEDQVVFLRIQHLYVRGDELHHVLVAGDDEDFVPCSAASRARCRSRRRPRSPQPREWEYAGLRGRGGCKESGGEDLQAWLPAWPCNPRS